MKLDEVPHWLVLSVMVPFGILWGSFLNVVIHRLPRDMSVVTPGSTCPACGKAIAFYDNVPILSWIVLRGRARCCGARVSPRYPIVELLGGLLSFGIVELVLPGLGGGVTVAHASLVYLSDLALLLGLLAAAFIDAEHMYLPDPITLGGAALGLVTAPLRDLPWTDAIVGGAVGFGLVWLPFIVGYKLLRGRPGMGLGDAKLLLLAGTWFGWVGALFVLFAGAIQGSIGAVVIYMVRGKIEEPESVVADREELQRLADAGDEEAKELLADDPLGEAQGEGLGQARMPFGPFLILACVELVLFGSWLDGALGALLAPFQP